MCWWCVAMSRMNSISPGAKLLCGSNEVCSGVLAQRHFGSYWGGWKCPETSSRKTTSPRTETSESSTHFPFPRCDTHSSQSS